MPAVLLILRRYPRPHFLVVSGRYKHVTVKFAHVFHEYFTRGNHHLML